MSLLAKVVTGKIKKNHFITLVGSSGVGKTTMACDSPNPIVIQTEEGSNSLNVARFPLAKSSKDVLAAIDELQNSNHPYKSVVIDSLDQLETLIWKDVCKENNAKEITDLAYGKGYSLALKIWQDMMLKLIDLREKMNVIMICHSQVKTVNDPMKSASYDRHELKLQQKAAALVKELSDAVLFATFDIVVIESKTGKGKAFGEGKRVLLTHGMPGHEAKNRFGLPYELPLSWEALMEAIDAGNPESAETLLEQIKMSAESIKDPATKEKVLSVSQEAANDPNKLSKIYNKVLVLIGEGK